MNKRLLLILALAVLIAAPAEAQNYKRVGPKQPPAAPKPRKDPAPKVALIEEDPDDEVKIPEVKGIVIVDDVKKVKIGGVPEAKGLVLIAPEYLRHPRLQKIANRYLGRSIGSKGIKRLQLDILELSRDLNRRIVDIIFLEQNVTSGVIQIAVVEGRVNEIRIVNAGRKWFSDEFILKNLSVHKGSVIEDSQLFQDLNWLNRNAFFREVNIDFKSSSREVDAAFKVGPPGSTDLEVQVIDRLPLRGYVGYEDSGTKILGRDRALAGFNWGNVFGLDHQLNYQYTADIDWDHFQAHAASYVAPLPWRHVLTLFGAYSDVEADLAPIGFPGFEQEGENFQASLRYAIPLPLIGRYDHEIGFGADFKRTENALEFNRLVLSDEPTEIIQFLLSYRGAIQDDFGQTIFSAYGYYSPGNLSGKNEDNAFEQTRPKSDVQYYYIRVEGERTTNLPKGFQWLVRGAYQFTRDNLLPSEQFGLGGYDTIRGYEERLSNGDRGWLLSNEFWTPPIPIRTQNTALGQLNFLVFYAMVEPRLSRVVALDDRETFLASAGAGLRLRIRNNLQLRFDYGFQLRERDLDEERRVSSRDSRMHLGVIASF